jgi:hypothetical protein
MEYTAPVLGHVGVEAQCGGREVEDRIVVEDGPRDTGRKREAEGRVDEHDAHRWWETLRKTKTRGEGGQNQLWKRAWKKRRTDLGYRTQSDTRHQIAAGRVTHDNHSQRGL